MHDASDKSQIARSSKYCSRVGSRTFFLLCQGLDNACVLYPGLVIGLKRSYVTNYALLKDLLCAYEPLLQNWRKGGKLNGPDSVETQADSGLLDHCIISFSNSLRSAVVFHQHLLIGQRAFCPRRARACSFAGVCCSMVMVGFPLRARHSLAKCSDPVLLAIMPIFAALAFPELDTGALFTQALHFCLASMSRN